MPAESELELLGRRLRKAVTSGLWGEARQLADTYGERLGESVRSGTPEHGRQELAAALDLFRWARRACLASRAQAMQQYSEIRARAPYRRTGQAAGSTFEIRG